MIEEQSFFSYDQMMSQMCAQVRQMTGAAGKAVVLVSSFERAEQVKHALSDAGAGFGVAVETPMSWIADLWEIYGDGRSLSQPMERSLLFHRILRQRLDEEVAGAFSDAPGMVDALSRLASDVLARVVGDSCDDLGLSDAEAEVVQLLRLYAQQAFAVGLVEVSQVVEQLVRAHAVETVPVLVLDCPTTVAHDALLASAASCVRFALLACETTQAARACELQQLSQALYHTATLEPLAATGAVRFVLPAGRYSEGALLAKNLCEAVDRGAESIALSAKEPYALFEELAPRLMEQGIGVRVEGSVSFKRSAFGIAWGSLLRYVTGARHASVSRASDFALSAFSFMNASAAHWLDARMRGWRAQTLEEALTDISAVSEEDHRDMIAAVGQDNYVAALTIMRDWIGRRSSWPESYRVVQQATAQEALDIFSRAEQWGVSPEDALAALQARVCVFRAEAGMKACRAWVDISSLGSLSARVPASYDVCVLSDLTAQAYPLAEKEYAVDGLLKKLGLYREPQGVQRLRAQFSCAMATARNEVLLEHRLKDAETEDERPCALFDELLDCYRVDPRNNAELHKEWGIPQVLVPYAQSKGEQDFAADRYADACLPPVAGQVPAGPTARLEQLREEEVLLTCAKSSDAQARLPRFSASAIEKYLACPYLWFAQRRINASAPDAGFGPLEKGNFAHELLQRFHSYLHNQGVARVTDENLKWVMPWFDELFQALALEHAQSYKSGSLVATNSLEAIEIERLEHQLRDFVVWEASILPGFQPAKAEYAFGNGDLNQPEVEYAGISLVGSIDRVDVDDFGHAVVLDYKGSAGTAYNFREKGATAFALPNKVQTAIYAQVLRRALGVTPVGALYVSYGKKKGCAGLYDGVFFDGAKALPGINVEACESMSFLDDLDRIEEAVARALDRLRAGYVDPSVKDKKTCTYCPVHYCRVRDGVKEGEA